MDESTFWAYLRRGMKGYWHAQRHEDKLTLGIPDVSYGARKANGWIELKYLPAWPKQAKTEVKIEHYTTEQKRWLRNRGQYGGLCWLFLRVGDEFMLFDWQQAQLVGKLTKSELLTLCDYHWTNSIEFDKLVFILAGR